MNRHILPLAPRARRKLELKMRDRRLSEVQLARLLGVSRSTLRRAIAGADIRPETFKTLTAWL